MPSAETKNNEAPSNMVARRPNRSATLPAKYAPAAEPSSAEATAKPVTNSLRANWPCTASTAPLTTEESKPKRNPPTAAEIAKPMTFSWSFLFVAAIAASRLSSVPVRPESAGRLLPL